MPTFHTKILLGDFNAKLGREENLELPIGKETLYKDSNDNGVTVWLQQNIHKQTWNSPHKKSHNQIDRVLPETVY